MNVFGALLVTLTTSYVAWFIERHELRVVYPFDSAYSTPDTAGEARLKETRFPTDDGEELIVWRAEAAAGKPTVLYLPGNAGTLSDRAWRYGRMLDQGFGVVAPAYRGSSGSSGAPTEATLTADALALAESIEARPLILYGESLGTAIAIKLAADGVGDALVLEAPFTSIPELVARQYPAENVGHLFTQIWDSAGRASGVTQPLLVVHGEADTLVPLDMGQTIFAAASSAQKDLVVVPDQGHHAMWTSPVQDAVFAFLATF